MNVLYIYAHPEPRSFNCALKDTAMLTLARAGHEVKASNLYAIKFKAVLDSADFRIRANPDLFNPAGEQMHGFATRSLAPDILEEIDKIAWADILIFQFPIWWSYMPAILKGWIDRVFVQGFVVDLRDGRVYDRGLLKGKSAMIVATCGSPEEMYMKGGIHGDLREHLSIITHNIFEFTGMAVLPSFIVYNVPAMTREEGEKQLDRYRHVLEML
ncbi:MAG: NAD(P)H-dependent oxidoreductase [Methanoregulaceae archaeon]|nr:NAD(P)H-dependent oxidoreductase [Methanoregulaceae archaeon]